MLCQLLLFFKALLDLLEPLLAQAGAHPGPSAQGRVELGREKEFTKLKESNVANNYNESPKT